MCDSESIRIVEWFSGIGGVAEAIRLAALPMQTVAAIDIDQDASRTYQLNFGLRPHVGTIESLPTEKMAAWAESADLWWMSPPCQPYCVRSQETREAANGDGERCADRDPRGNALRRIVRFLNDVAENRVAVVLPRFFVVENVPQFLGSCDYRELRTALEQNGYSVTERLLCPTQFGIPNRRLRAYVMAVRAGDGRAANEKPSSVVMESGLSFVGDLEQAVMPLSNFLDAEPDPSLFLADEQVRRFRSAMNVVRPADSDAITACFASGYGRSAIRSGSYLLNADGRLRSFSPDEVARLLGFGESFRFPDSIGCRRRWKLLGNSLSISVVRKLLSEIATQSANSPVQNPRGHTSSTAHAGAGAFR